MEVAMKCNKCQDQLYEYFDGTLTPSMREAVQEHLAQCPACNAVFEHERQFSKSVTGLFEQQTRDLSLAPQISQTVMARLRELPQENQLTVSENRGPFLTYSAQKVGTDSLSVRPDGKIRRNRLLRPTWRLIPIFNRSSRELMRIAAVIAILLTGFYIGNTVWQKKAPDEIRANLEKGTDWRYILVSPRTCYFLNRPELQLMQ
jgi:hypothetical protein